MAAKRIGIIGDGNVGSALERGLKRGGAVPFGAVDGVVRIAGDTLAGKTVVDVTNALDNQMNWEHMDPGRLDGAPLTAFAAGDDAAAKADVLELEREIGFDAVDAGPLKNARLLEPLGYLNIQLGYGLKMGTDTGFRLMHR